jgi:hypothetical protein
MWKIQRRLPFWTTLSVALIAGCGGKNAGQNREQADINAIATAYRSYAQARGGPPPNEQKLREFIQSLPNDKRAALRATDIDSVFISPRDKKPYVVAYGEKTKGRIPHYFVYEQEGSSGKRWAACSMGYVSEVNQAELDKWAGQ